MHDLFGSVRRSLAFHPSTSGKNEGGGITVKIGSCLRKSRIGLGLGFGGVMAPKLPPPPPPPQQPQQPAETDDAPAIRWRKGELIGCGAFGHVYMGMNLDSGELLAVKQVLIGKSDASKEKAQAHIRELEEEVNLLKKLSHPNIVRYLGTAREEDTLNILLEFVPGGSISSLLGKFGSFPEAVIRMYTKQLLQGLEYLHKHGIIHRDIKGANILVDNKGCIKLADFGASKQVAKLATTMNAAKSMKGTPYWMAPEVILQTGHTFSADIWSVGCTVIEMATGKPPWSQQYQEVAALFHIGSTKSHPPIPEHLSSDAKDFLLKCLQQEPKARSEAHELLQHAFVTKDFNDIHPVHRPAVEPFKNVVLPSKLCTKSINNLVLGSTTSYGGSVNDDSGGGCSTMSPERACSIRPIWEMSASSDDMCQLDDKDDFPVVRSSFNPMSEPLDDWTDNFDISSEKTGLNMQSICKSAVHDACTEEDENGFTFSSEPVADDDVTESKIRAFLDEKAFDLKKLQTPLYEEFFNSLNNNESCDENETKTLKLPPKGKMSPSKITSEKTTPLKNMGNKLSPGIFSRRVSSVREPNDRVLKEISPQLNEDFLQVPNCPSDDVSEMKKRWKKELDQELEMMRQGAFGKASSPRDGCLTQKKERMRSTSSGK